MTSILRSNVFLIIDDDPKNLGHMTFQKMPHSVNKFGKRELYTVK